MKQKQFFGGKMSFSGQTWKNPARPNAHAQAPLPILVPSRNPLPQLAVYTMPQGRNQYN